MRKSPRFQGNPEFALGKLARAVPEVSAWPGGQVPDLQGERVSPVRSGRRPGILIDYVKDFGLAGVQVLNPFTE